MHCKVERVTRTKVRQNVLRQEWCPELATDMVEFRYRYGPNDPPQLPLVKHTKTLPGGLAIRRKKWIDDDESQLVNCLCTSSWNCLFTSSWNCLFTSSWNCLLTSSWNCLFTSSWCRNSENKLKRKTSYNAEVQIQKSLVIQFSGQRMHQSRRDS